MGAVLRRRLLRLFFVLAFFLLSLPLPLEASQTLLISIPRTVSAEDSAFALADVAVLSGPSDLTARAGALILSAPEGSFTREQVISALKVSGIEGVNVALKMPDTVTVERVRGGREGAPGADEKKLAGLLRELALWEGGVQVHTQSAVPEGRLVSPSALVPGTPAATLKFQDASGRERSLAVRMTWTQPALVLTRSVPKGRPLNGADLVVREIRVNAPNVYASRSSEVVGRSLRKKLSQGDPVPLDLVVDMPIIERGKSVTLVVRSGGLSVKARGEALESGTLGAVIKVRNLSSKTVLTGVVVAPDTVEVKMP